jgi:predicted RNase H-like HicB family nuclease
MRQVNRNRLSKSCNPLEPSLFQVKFEAMKYPVIFIPSEEGFAVGCPALPDCWSQGNTKAEALANIREAIQLWLEVAEEDARAEVTA